MKVITMKNSIAVRLALLFTASISLLSSCTKFLAEEPTGALTDEYAFSTAAEGNALTYGAYRSLAAYTAGAGDWAIIFRQLLNILQVRHLLQIPMYSFGSFKPTKLPVAYCKTLIISGITITRVSGIVTCRSLKYQA